MPNNGTEQQITITAREIMSSPVITISEDATVAEAATLMLKHRIGALIVIDADGMFAGLVSERQFLPVEVIIPYMRGRAFRLLGKEIADMENLEETMAGVGSTKIGDVMAEGVHTDVEDTHAADLAEFMITENHRHSPILRNGRPVGMVSRHDFMRILTQKMADGAKS